MFIVKTREVTISEQAASRQNKTAIGLGKVAHACNPDTLADKAGGSLETRSLRPAGVIERDPSLQKNLKISQVRWCMPVVPAPARLRREDCLSPRGQGGSELWEPLHSSLGDSRILSLFRCFM